MKNCFLLIKNIWSFWKLLYEEKDMKRVIAIGLIAIVTFCTACNKKQESKQNDKLFYAIEQENYQAVKECLNDKNLDLEHLTLSDRTQFAKKDERALGFAMDQVSEIKGSEEISLLLIKAGADADSFKGLNTYLQCAAGNEKYELVKALVESGASVNKKGKENGHRALDEVINLISPKNEQKSKQIIEYLIKKEAAFDNDTLKSVMDSEWRYNYTAEVIKKIKKQGRSVKISKALNAAIDGDNKELQKYIKNKNINKKDEKDVILYASANCNLQTIEMLYKNGYNFKIVDDYAMNPLHIASLCNDESVVEFLFDKNINSGPKYQEDEMENYSALDYAVISGNDNKYEYLKKHKVKTATKQSVWEAATTYGNEDSIKLLKKNFYKPSEKEILQGYMHGNDKVINEMINQKYTINVIKGELTSQSSIEAIKKLYQKMNVKISQETMESLVEARDNIFIKNIIKAQRYQGTLNKEKLLYYAIDTGNLDLVKYFTKLGADINKIIKVEGNQCSSFHKAAESLSQDILKYLINEGGNIHKKNGEGKNAIEIAKDIGYEENEKLLGVEHPTRIFDPFISATVP